MFVAEESVPDTRKASILNKLLSEHFPACDLQKTDGSVYCSAYPADD